MNGQEEILSGIKQNGEIQFEEYIRPQKLHEFIGQHSLRKKLRIFLEAAKNRDEALEHALFYGPPGLGKTTLAHIISQECGVNIQTTSGPILERPGSLAGVLTNVQGKDIIFIDEIHRLPKNVEEYLYPAMEDFCIDIIIDKGPAARSMRINLDKFTLIGATTRAGLISSPLRSRFGIIERIDYYPPEELYEIVIRSARILDIPIDESGAQEVAKRSRGTPRIANRLLRRVRDYAQVEGDGTINKSIAQDALNLFNIDELGLDEMDKRILRTIIDNYNGGPVGIKTISVAVGEAKGTIEELYEPFLIQQGFLQRTSNGRIATKLAYRHLKLTPAQSSSLFN